MFTRRPIILTILLLALLATLPDARAFHHPRLGRFMQRDPLGYVDGMSTYQYHVSSPLKGLDPSGLKWKVERKSHLQSAIAESDCNDTIEDLAKITNMEPSSHQFWLRSENGDSMPNGWIKGEKEKIKKKMRFSIPNTIYVLVSKMNVIARYSLGGTPTNVEKILTQKGFYVIYKDWRWVRPWGSNDVQGRGAYGLVYFGHGLAGSTRPKKKITGIFGSKDSLTGFLDPAGDGSRGYIGPPRFRNGQLGLMILKSCFAAQNGQWPDIVSSTAQKKGAMYLGNGMEMTIATWGIEDVARKAE